MNRRKTLKQVGAILGFAGISRFLTQCTYPFVPTVDQPFVLLLNKFESAVWQNDYLEISWYTKHVRTINISYSADGGSTWEFIQQEMDAAQLSYRWKFELDPNPSYLIKIEDTEHLENFHISPSLKITPTISIDLSDLGFIPEKGEKITVNSTPLGDIFIERMEDRRFDILSLICPHNGCTVAFSPDSTGGRFNCPCHGSAFTAEGCLINGPAAEALQKYDGKLLELEQVLLVSKKLSKAGM